MNDVKYMSNVYENFKVLGPHILVQRFENEEHKVGDIFIPDSKKYLNDKIGVGKIIEMGKIAEKESNLKVGDYVLYDFFSIFADCKPNVLINYENIFLQLNEEEAKEFLNGNLL